MTSYTVNVDRDEALWRVRVREVVRATSAQDLAAAEATARDLIAITTDQDPDMFDLEVNLESFLINDHTVAAARAEHSWHVEAPDLAVVAQARHLGELEEMAKDLVAIYMETSHGTLIRTCPITVISDSCQTTFPGR